MRFKDAINPKKWLIFIKSMILKKIGGYHFNNAEELAAFCEQAAYRMSECSECVLAGKCRDCGCKSKELFLEKDNWCSEEKWGEMMSAEDWNQYKKDTGFKLIPYYE